MLVEETAAYLDGDRRQQSKALGRAAALAYATESMRLTTRLMQLARGCSSIARSRKARVARPGAPGKGQGQLAPVDPTDPDMLRSDAARTVARPDRTLSEAS